MKNIITFSLSFFVAFLSKADTIPSWKVFHNSKLLKEIKLGNEYEEIKIDTLSSKREDYLDILYYSFKPSEDFIYDILVESETSIDLKIYNNENAKLRTESSVELYFARINNKNKPIRIDFQWLIDFLKEYPQNRIRVILMETNRREKHFSQTKLFYIINK